MQAITLKPRLTVFINAIATPVLNPCSMMAVLSHCRTGEEKLLDILLPDSSFATLATAVRDRFSLNWQIVDSWEVSNDRS